MHRPSKTPSIEGLDTLKSVVTDLVQNMEEEGISEYDLLARLREDARLEGQLDWSSGDNHALFRSHFLLLHCLYQLRDEWHQAQSAHLDIRPLKIQRLP